MFPHSPCPPEAYMICLPAQLSIVCLRVHPATPFFPHISHIKLEHYEDRKIKLKLPSGDQYFGSALVGVVRNTHCWRGHHIPCSFQEKVRILLQNDDSRDSEVKGH